MNHYKVFLHTDKPVALIYEGTDETLMYSHVTAMETVLRNCAGTADIEILQNEWNRFIQYRNGERTDLD